MYNSGIVLPDEVLFAMIYVDNENITDPRVNLAIEEYLL